MLLFGNLNLLGPFPLQIKKLDGIQLKCSIHLKGSSDFFEAGLLEALISGLHQYRCMPRLRYTVAAATFSSIDKLV